MGGSVVQVGPSMLVLSSIILKLAGEVSLRISKHFLTWVPIIFECRERKTMNLEWKSGAVEPGELDDEVPQKHLEELILGCTNRSSSVDGLVFPRNETEPAERNKKCTWPNGLRFHLEIW